MVFANQYFIILGLLFNFVLAIQVNSHHTLNVKNSNILKNKSQKNDDIVERSMFPQDFLFGVSTSSYQIEGAYMEDGKGLSNWDVFSHVPGNIKDKDTGDVAVDHYHRYNEDIKLLMDLGVNAYRFSISWARILPKGRFGEINRSGVLFYNKIIDNLLLNGIQPFVTIQHFDHPHELQKRYGAWLSPLIQEDFVHFARICFEEFGDRVKHWVTVNEPNIYAEGAYVKGIFAPGRCSPPFGNCSSGNSDVESLIVVHNMLLSHAKAVQLYRDQFQPKQQGSIGIVVYASAYVPYRDDDNFSRQAVERAFVNNVAWVLDPLIYGEYPSLLRSYHGNELPKFTKEEAKLIKGSVDFFGINHYTTLYAIDCFHYSSECDSLDNRAIRGFVKTNGYRDGVPIGEQAGTSRFFMVPEGMEISLDFIVGRYPNITIYVTENGYSPPCASDEFNMLHDIKRVEYLRTYIAALARVIRRGAKVKGYFAWSLMDNFEWSDGYTQTYGLYYVDRPTLRRTPKLSARWYARFLENPGLVFQSVSFDSASS